MKITVQDFVQEIKDKKIQNTKINEHAVSDHIRKTLEIQTYIPFKTKRKIVEMIVEKDMSEVDGIKKHDSIGGYITFVIAMLSVHTSLTFSEDKVSDYDLLAESKLLPHIIAEFKESYDEFDALVKVAIEAELEDNNVNALIGHFLDRIRKKVESFNLKDILGADIKQEDLAKFISFLDKIK